jgi:hypothetical protein
MKISIANYEAIYQAGFRGGEPLGEGVAENAAGGWSETICCVSWFAKTWI